MPGEEAAERRLIGPPPRALRPPSAERCDVCLLVVGVSAEFSRMSSPSSEKSGSSGWEEGCSTDDVKFSWTVALRSTRTSGTADLEGLDVVGFEVGGCLAAGGSSPALTRFGFGLVAAAEGVLRFLTAAMAGVNFVVDFVVGFVMDFVGRETGVLMAALGIGVPTVLLLGCELASSRFEASSTDFKKCRKSNGLLASGGTSSASPSSPNIPSSS